MNKIVKYILVTFVVLILLLGAFSGGFIAGQFSSRASSTADSQKQTLFVPFWEAWDLVHKQYVDQPVDDTKLMQGAIRGMLESLGDAHTSYMDPQTYKQSNDELAGEYEGIGAYVDTRGDYLKVTSPIAHSPAEKAGIKSGDLIVAIDGKDMTGINPEVARLNVLGPAGTTVILTIKREGTEKPFDVKVTRAKITVASIESKMLDNGIGYIKLNVFGDKTSNELKAALKDLMAQNPKGLILDLRNNGGGYLQTAEEVASQFIKEGVIVSEKYGNGRVDKNDALPGGLAINIPLVVLVNEGTASSSEVVSGAIQDYGRGKLVGVTTYGKGSVQIHTPLASDQGGVSITIAKWLTPKDRLIDKIGLTPDVVVEMTKEDYDKGLDPQLEAAIQTLLGMLK